MKKIIAILLITAMLICGCGKADKATEAESTEAAGTETTDGTAEPTEAPTDAPTEPSSDATEPSEAPAEPSNEELVDPEPDPYAEIKANPLPLLDMTFGEFEAVYGELEIKEYRDGYTGEAYSPELDMYLEANRYIYRSQGIPKEEQVFGLFVNSLDSLGVKAGMSSDEIDLSGWNLYVGIRIVASGEEWYEPAVDGNGPIWNYSDDFRYGHTLEAFKEIDGYWYTVIFYLPEEYEECDYSSSNSFEWRDVFAEEVRSKERSLTVARVFVRKEGSASL